MLDVQLLKRIWPVIVGTGVAMIPMETTPFLISGVMQTAKLNQAQAGWAGSAAVCSMAAASMLIAPWLTRLPYRRSMLMLAGLTVGAYAGLAFATSYWAVLLFTVLGGLGAGGLLAGMAMYVAGLPNPDAAYGYIYACTGAAFALYLFLLPVVADALGANAMFGMIALVGGLAAAALYWLRPPAHVETEGADGPPKIRWELVAIVALVMTIGFPIYGGVFGMAERKAVQVGMSSIQAGETLAVSALLSIVGSLLVAVIGVRFGRLLPTVTVMVLATVAYFLTLGGHTPQQFVAGLLLFGFMQLTLNSYFFGLASALDRGGRVAAALQGYSLIPYALGPGLFVTFVGDGPLSQLALPAVAVNTLALGLLLPVLFALDRNARSAACGQAAPITP